MNSGMTDFSKYKMPTQTTIWSMYHPCHVKEVWYLAFITEQAHHTSREQVEGRRTSRPGTTREWIPVWSGRTASQPRSWMTLEEQPSHTLSIPYVYQAWWGPLKGLQKEYTVSEMSLGPHSLSGSNWADLIKIKTLHWRHVELFFRSPAVVGRCS